RGEQEFARLGAERFDVERGTFLEGTRGADRVDAADEAPQPFERALVLELGRAPALAREKREAEAFGLEERAPVEGERGDDLDLGRRQLEREGVLLEDLRVRPAPRAIELRDDEAAVLEARLVDAVLVAVQGEEAPVGTRARRVDGVQHEIGREA